jgi:hypothetical protein
MFSLKEARKKTIDGLGAKYIERLQAGETVQVRPRGNSMRGKIESGQLCTVAPIADSESIKVGDIVLCRVHGAQYLHLVKAVRDGQFQIGNNRGGNNGWVAARSLFGLLVEVAD